MMNIFPIVNSVKCTKFDTSVHFNLDIYCDIMYIFDRYNIIFSILISTNGYKNIPYREPTTNGNSR